ncbi:MAG: NAD(P)-binding domain-containing protein [Nocardioidaceae bacterium]
MTADDVAGFLADYAAAFDLPVLLNTRLTRLSRADDGYVATTTQVVLRARQVVVATGAFQRPVVPGVAEGSARRSPSSTAAST